LISFNKWLRNFGIEEGPPDESPYTIQRALHDRYRSIRATNDPYPTTDYDKAHISASGAIEYSEKVFARAREPYGHIALLTNGEENKNGSIDGWFYREYKGASHGQAGERLSLNVFMAPGLIRKLDEILEEDKGENIKQYKVPENWRGWIHRHDPATIYFEKLTPELAEKIVKAIYGGGICDRKRQRNSCNRPRRTASNCPRESIITRSHPTRMSRLCSKIWPTFRCSMRKLWRSSIKKAISG
jgi:hypothetical protein